MQFTARAGMVESVIMHEPKASALSSSRPRRECCKLHITRRGHNNCCIVTSRVAKVYLWLPMT